MKKIFCLGFLVLFFCVGCSQEKEVLDCKGAEQKALDGVILLDVRSKAEYNNSHLDGAMHLDVSELADKALEVFPDKEQEMIVYCQSGMRSAQALRILEDLGYSHVSDLSGGMNGC